MEAHYKNSTKRMKKEENKSQLRKGISYFESTRDSCPSLLKLSSSLVDKLNNYWVQESLKPDDLRDEEKLFLSKWIATTISQHQENLSEVVDKERDKISMIPTLIEGFVKKVGNDTDEISDAIKEIKLAIKHRKTTTQKIKKLKEEIHKKEKLADFFEKEVHERSEDFCQSLSKYITHHCVIKHLIGCSKDLLSQDENKWIELEDKLKSVPNPLNP
jgi:hypothetical protein